MISWDKMPREISYLFNPSFNSLVLYSFVKGYQSNSKKSIPYPLLFLVLPLILHKTTREILPRKTSSKFHFWVTSNLLIRLNLVKRIKGMEEFTKEAIVFAFQNNVLEFGTNQTLIIKSGLKTNSLWEKDSECNEILKKAEFLGKWFANYNPLDIFIMLGVKP